MLYRLDLEKKWLVTRDVGGGVGGGLGVENLAENLVENLVENGLRQRDVGGDVR